MPGHILTLHETLVIINYVSTNFSIEYLIQNFCEFQTACKNLLYILDSEGLLIFVYSRLCVKIEREMFPDDHLITYYLLVTEDFTIEHLQEMVRSSNYVCTYNLLVHCFVTD